MIKYPPLTTTICFKIILVYLYCTVLFQMQAICEIEYSYTLENIIKHKQYVLDIYIYIYTYIYIYIIRCTFISG